MAIYGFGAIYDTGDVSDEFVQNGVACVGWDENDAPPLFDILRNIKNGDLVYLKSYNPTAGLTIKAVGVVTDRTIAKRGKLREGVVVTWVWQGKDSSGLLGDKFIRTVTLYEEHNPEIHAKVIGHLLAGCKIVSARKK